MSRDPEGEDLGLDVIAALDRDDMLGAIRGMADQLAATYAAARQHLSGAADGARRALKPAVPTGVVVCGMGGSAIGADLVIASLPELPVPAAVVRGYALPAWAGPADPGCGRELLGRD